MGYAFFCARSEEGETHRRDRRLYSWHVSRAPRPLRTSFVWKRRAKKVILPVLQAGTQLPQESLGIEKPNEADSVRCQPRSHGM